MPDDSSVNPMPKTCARFRAAIEATNGEVQELLAIGLMAVGEAAALRRELHAIRRKRLDALIAEGDVLLGQSARDDAK